MKNPAQISMTTWGESEEILRFIRSEVFLREQNIPADLEWDGDDDKCSHLLAEIEGKAVGTARLQPSGKIERMAVLREFRGHGIGAALLQRALAELTKSGATVITLSAQESAIPFYEKHGFQGEGVEFIEAGIIHRKMIYFPGV